MAKTTKEPLDKKTIQKLKKVHVGINETAQDRAGQSLILFSVALLVALSLYIHGQEDQSAVSELTDRSETVQNWLGKSGAF
jgi:S-DNA-T family DNA segregation ATPase FtsK/SpoIIIE